MEKARINDVDIAYEVRGDGEPVLLIHGAFIADAFKPLAGHPSLAANQVIWYHRRGYGESAGEPGTDVVGHANDALALLDHLGVSSAHIVGHSYGGSTAIALAAAAPDRVKSLSLLEPAVMAVPSADTLSEALPQIIGPFFEGNADEALDGFFKLIFGGDYRRIIDDGVGPAAWAQVQADADDAFAGDLTTLGAWEFGPEQSSVITCPTLLVLGEDSVIPNREVFAKLGIKNPDVDMFREMIGVIASWLPQAELVTLPGLNHALEMQDVGAVAAVVAPFLAKNRSTVTA